jgi:hypothetical protein
VLETLTRREIEARLGAVDSVWGPRLREITDGPERGQRQIDLTTASGLDVTVLPDQFLDLGRASWLGVPVSFHPAHTGPSDVDWRRRWSGGLLTTCGLDNVGPATPGGAGMHGRASSIAASLVRASAGWDGDRYRVTVAGKMREAVLFGQNITVERTISIEAGESVLTLRDIVRNEAFEPQTVLLLYHINLGWPLVDDGSAIEVDGERQFLGRPVVGNSEQVERLRPAPENGDGWTHACLAAPDGRACRISWRPVQLPFFTIWRSEVAGSYAVGLEPGTCWPGGAPVELADGRGRQLGPGCGFAVDLRIHLIGDRGIGNTWPQPGRSN